jgi:hypothetical protein
MIDMCLGSVGCRPGPVESLKTSGGGANRMVEVTPKNGKAAERMIAHWHHRHPKDDFTLDPIPNKLSTVLGGGPGNTEPTTREFVRYIERRKNEGNVAKSEEPTHRQSSVHFQESSGYGEAIAAARAEASRRPEEERQRNLDIAARASYRFDSYRAGLLTAVANLPVPTESAAGIAKSLTSKKFESISGFSPIGHQGALKRAARALVHDVLGCAQPAFPLWPARTRPW